MLCADVLGYYLAKLVIRLIVNVAKVVVSYCTREMATDQSEQ